MLTKAFARNFPGRGDRQAWGRISGGVGHRVTAYVRSGAFAHRALILMGLISALAACGTGADSSQSERRLRYSFGLNPRLDRAALERTTADETEILNSLRVRAGITTLPPASSPDWKQVADAGMNFVDEECEAYVDSLFWYNRAATTARSELNLIGAAAATTLGVVDAAAKSIALTAAAFGLAGASIDVASSGLLYKIDPTAVRTLIERRQSAYRIAFQQNSYTTRPAAMRAVSDYLSLCLPASLESEITTSVTSTGYQPSGAGGTLNAPITLQRYTQLREPPPVAPGRSDREQGAGVVGGNLYAVQRQMVQRALCVPADGRLGPEGSSTQSRQAIRFYHAAASPERRASDRLTESDLADLTRAGDCDTTMFLNAYERFLLSRFDRQSRRYVPDTDAIRQLQRRLGVQDTAKEGVFDKPTRDAIDAFIRSKQADPKSGLTPELDAAIPAAG